MLRRNAKRSVLPTVKQNVDDICGGELYRVIYDARYIYILLLFFFVYFVATLRHWIIV